MCGGASPPMPECTEPPGLLGHTWSMKAPKFSSGISQTSRCTAAPPLLPGGSATMPGLVLPLASVNAYSLQQKWTWIDRVGIARYSKFPACRLQLRLAATPQRRRLLRRGSHVGGTAQQSGAPVLGCRAELPDECALQRRQLRVERLPAQVQAAHGDRQLLVGHGQC